MYHFSDSAVYYSNISSPITCNECEGSLKDMKLFFEDLNLSTWYLECHSPMTYPIDQATNELFIRGLETDVLDNVTRESLESCSIKTVATVVNLLTKKFARLSDGRILMQCSDIASKVAATIATAYYESNSWSLNVPKCDKVHSPARPQQIYGNGISYMVGIVCGLLPGLYALEYNGWIDVDTKAGEFVKIILKLLEVPGKDRSDHKSRCHFRTEADRVAFLNPALDESGSPVNETCRVINNFCDYVMGSNHSFHEKLDLITSGLLIRSLDDIIDELYSIVTDRNPHQVKSIADKLRCTILAYSVKRPMEGEHQSVDLDRINVIKELHIEMVKKIHRLTNDKTPESESILPCSPGTLPYSYPPKTVPFINSTPILSRIEPHLFEKDYLFGYSRIPYAPSDLFNEVIESNCKGELLSDNPIEEMFNFISHEVDTLLSRKKFSPQIRLVVSLFISPGLYIFIRGYILVLLMNLFCKFIYIYIGITDFFCLIHSFF